MKDSEERLRPCLQGAAGVVIIGAETGSPPQAPAFSVRLLPSILTCLSHGRHLRALRSHVTSLSDSGPNTGHPQLLPGPVQWQLCLQNIPRAELPLTTLVWDDDYLLP